MKLVRFLLELAEDPDLVAEFRRNPQPVMERFKLSKEEKEAVHSRDAAKIRDAIKAGRPAHVRDAAQSDLFDVGFSSVIGHGGPR